MKNRIGPMVGKILSFRQTDRHANVSLEGDTTRAREGTLSYLLRQSPKFIMTFSQILKIVYLKTISALQILYSARMVLTVSRSSSDCGTMVCMLIPPFSFFLNRMLGGSLFNLVTKLLYWINKFNNIYEVHFCPNYHNIFK